MSQQFRIDSESLRDKINQLLPSQARGSINVDLTGQTTIVPIVDLTETAEGSTLRQDLQTSMSLASMTTFNIKNTSSTIVNTTGYWRVFGGMSIRYTSAVGARGILSITDGVTTKSIFELTAIDNLSSNEFTNTLFDFVIKLEAGDSLTGNSNANQCEIIGNVRQIADLSGNLVNP